MVHRAYPLTLIHACRGDPSMNSWLISLIQFLFILAIAPLSVGLVRWMKARFQGRHGANPLLPYLTIATLLKKQMVISKSTSWVFRVVPFVVFGTSLFLVLVLPLIVQQHAASQFSDMFVVAGVLAISALFLVLGGLESASAFGGMGASRGMTIALRTLSSDFRHDCIGSYKSEA